MKRWTLKAIMCRLGLHDPAPELAGFHWVTCRRCGTPLN